MRALRVEVTGPEKCVRPHKERVRQNRRGLMSDESEHFERKILLFRPTVRCRAAQDANTLRRHRKKVNTPHK